MKAIDLHTHSTASDGTFTPEEVIKAAVEAGLSAVALTDHDTLAGLDEAMEAARAYHIRCIPGIELSSDYKGRDIHIVGLGLDLSDPDLPKAIQSLLRRRDQRNEKIIQKMQNAGIDITMDKLRQRYGDAVITRANFARYLTGVGFCSSISEVFDRYLGPGMPFYVSKEPVSPAEVIAIIRHANGIPVLAHPLAYGMDLKELKTFIEMLKPAGLKAMEVFYSTHTPEDERNMRRLAEKTGLYMSGGSDFHGAAKPAIAIGKGLGHLFVPEELMTKMGL